MNSSLLMNSSLPMMLYQEKHLYLSPSWLLNVSERKKKEPAFYNLESE